MFEYVDRRSRLARVWSNSELKKVGYLFSGRVANISAADDEDKQGNTYSDYFSNSSEYFITNYAPGKFRGWKGRSNEHYLDLVGEVPQELGSYFDVVFNHTTFEHIFNVRKAFANFCKMTKDVAIVVLPFSQYQHEHEEAYRDYWRFTPTCARELFDENGLQIIYESANSDYNSAIYLFLIASKKPGRWESLMPTYVPLTTVGNIIGQPNCMMTAFQRLNRLGKRAIKKLIMR